VSNDLHSTTEGELIVTPFSEVEAEEITWVWPGRIIKGKLNMLVGHPDSGKSFITIDMAARVSAGREWPDGSGKPPLGKVIILAAEDDPSDTIRARLDAHGADISHVYFAKGVEFPSTSRIVQLDIDYRRLERKVQEVGAVLVIIDPVVSFISDKVKTNDEAAARRLLQPLADIAARTEAAIVGIMHLNKKPDLEKIQRVGGAMAFVGLVRSALYVEQNEKRPDTFTLSTLKLNVAKKAPVLSYHIENAYPGSDIGMLKWHDHLVDPSDSQKEHTVPSESERAVALLEEMLPEHRPDVPGCPTVELNAEAQTREISMPTLQRARTKRGVICKKVGDAWHLWLPPKDHKPPSKMDLFLNQSVSLRDYGEGDEGDDGLEGLEGVDDVGGVNGT